MRKIVILLMCVLLVGCATDEEVKAPCDYQGHFCGKKIKINSDIGD